MKCQTSFATWFLFLSVFSNACSSGSNMDSSEKEKIIVDRKKRLPWESAENEPNTTSPNNPPKEDNICILPGPPAVTARIFHENFVEKEFYVTLDSINSLSKDNNHAGSGQEVLQTSENSDFGKRRIGLRKKNEAGQIIFGYLDVFSFTTLVEGTNKYDFSLRDVETKNRIETKSSVATTTVYCGSSIKEIEKAEFVIRSDKPSSVIIDPKKEYFPLNNGLLFVLDSQSKIGEIVGSNRKWRDVEIVRQLDYSHTNGGGLFEESQVTNKEQIGEFEEHGIDRGELPKELPAHNMVFGEITILKIEDTLGRVLYGTPLKPS